MPRTRTQAASVDERRPVTRLDPAVRREQIVQAAARLFEGRGTSEVTFEEISDAAGVSRALVYNYFGDRGGLLAAVYLHHFADVNQRLREAASVSDDPEARTRALIAAYIEIASDHPNTWRMLASPAIDHPKVRAARRERMVGLAAHWDGSPVARVVASGIVGMLESATLDWLEGEDVDADHFAEVLFALVWHGFGTLRFTGAQRV